MQKNLETAFEGCLIRIRVLSVFKHLKNGQVVEKANFSFPLWRVRATAKITSVCTVAEYSGIPKELGLKEGAALWREGCLVPAVGGRAVQGAGRTPQDRSPSQLSNSLKSSLPFLPQGTPSSVSVWNLSSNISVFICLTDLKHMKKTKDSVSVLQIWKNILPLPGWQILKLVN